MPENRLKLIKISFEMLQKKTVQNIKKCFKITLKLLKMLKKTVQNIFQII